MIFGAFYDPFVQVANKQLKQVRSICDSRFEQIMEFLNDQNVLPTELYNPGFMTGLSGIAYALLKYTMPELPLIIGVEGIDDRNKD